MASPGYKHGQMVWRVAVCILSLSLSACAVFPSPSAPLSGTLRVWGSSALDPLVRDAAQPFMQLHPGVTIDAQAIGSFNGLDAVTKGYSDTRISGKAEIGTSDVYADPALYPQPDLTDHLVAVIPFTMVVNPGVPITTLTKQQLINIFSLGTITNWKQVGGPDLKIIPVVRPPTSGTRATFRKYILDGRDEHGLLSTDVSATIRDTVAKTPGAISYLAKSYLDGTITPISIDGYDATAANIAAGSYNFWSFEHMYTLDDTPPLIASFLNFMLSPTVQALATKDGYLPIVSILPVQTPSASALSHQQEDVPRCMCTK